MFILNLEVDPNDQNILNFYPFSPKLHPSHEKYFKCISFLFPSPNIKIYILFQKIERELQEEADPRTWREKQELIGNFCGKRKLAV